jgi:hypothetical protein
VIVVRGGRSNMLDSGDDDDDNHIQLAWSNIVDIVLLFKYINNVVGMIHTKINTLPGRFSLV